MSVIICKNIYHSACRIYDVIRDANRTVKTAVSNPTRNNLWLQRSVVVALKSSLKALSARHRLPENFSLKPKRARALHVAITDLKEKVCADSQIAAIETIKMSMALNSVTTRSRQSTL
ncbi:hypothetical protein [Donghicola sp.]|jgi:hypothetical protein|uniref:hypothetical protein n=1 Tax=Donghicola sp. TaxID=1929294 RepID=UPI0025D58D96|nr:hypothetical protein [Donghicola sp.]MCT4579555.1 hypothetical protein [Donghicola sp.]